jgi:hypothetical protein
MRLQEFGTRDADDHHRNISDSFGQRFDHRKHRRLSPLNVIDDDDQWRLSGNRFDVVPHGP